MNPSLDSLRSCFEGAVPAVIATVGTDGTPNVALLSQVHYMDLEHVALTFQFFNKTRANILVNPRAVVQVIDPGDGSQYRLHAKYLRTETEGPLFERMKAKLAGIASHTGMSKVFRLLGADVYRVLDVQAVSGGPVAPPESERALLAAQRRCAEQLNACQELEHVFDTLMHCLQEDFQIEHAMLLMYDALGERLYTVASFGYASSGVGSEIPMGAGVIGVAARARTPIRISHMTSDYSYGRAMRSSLEDTGTEAPSDLESEIPFPGLESPHSQLAVPIVHGTELYGVLHVESTRELRFGYLDEDALVSVAAHLALAVRLSHQTPAANGIRPSASGTAPRSDGPPLSIRHFRANNSVFIDDDYLIKGVAGAIFWRLVSEFSVNQRTEFSNRELRLDPAIGLPEIGDNLEARLILLQKRLRERCQFLAIEKTGRGRFRLRVERPLSLSEH